MATVHTVPGRIEGYRGPAAKPLVVVDYAHTPDALEKAVEALRPMAQARGGQLWCVFGCGGDRDATKRPLMGAIAQQGADRVVVTSDNPRHEAPQAIVDQIVAGMKDPVGSLKVQVEVDRRLAILQTLAAAGPQDVVLLMGYATIAHLATILVLSLFIAIVVTLGRRYRESEMTIWFASGISLARFVRPVLRMAWPNVVVMLAQSATGLIETYWVARIGTDAPRSRANVAVA